MARRRYTSTDISIDKKVNKLAVQYGDFAALLYTWMIPHAEDNCEISGDPEELMGIVCPLRRDKTEDDIKRAIYGMVDLKLVLPFSRDGKAMLLYPPKNFYKFQTYISRENRNYTSVDQRESAKNAEKNSCESLNTYSDKDLSEADAAKRRESPKNAVSLSLSPSPSPIELSNDNLSTEVDAQCSYQKIMELFNSTCVSLPKIKAITDGRRKTLQAWWKKDRIALDTLQNFFQRVEGSDFLTNRNGKFTGCSFDWIIKPTNRQKIIEGNFDNKSKKSGLEDF